MKYERAFNVSCDLSETALEEVAPLLGPSFAYELRVSLANEPIARRLVKTMGADTAHHPFAPHININASAIYGRDEWSIHANGKGFGSEGA